jgi:hypothetical protein
MGQGNSDDEGPYVKNQYESRSFLVKAWSVILPVFPAHV